MLKPSITTTERCVFHNNKPGICEIRLEADTPSGAVIQYYAAMCDDCSMVYDANPEGMIKHYKRLLKTHNAITIRRWRVN